MPRTYGTTNVMPYATAPPVGAVGDEYYNTASKQLFLSDGTQWNAIVGGGGGPGSPAYVTTITAPTAAGSPYTITHNLGFTTPLVQFYDATTLAQMMAQVVVLNANQIAVTFTANPPHNVTVVVSTGGMGPSGTTAPTGPWVGTIAAPVAGTSYPLVHSLNTSNPLVQFYDSVTLTQIVAQVTVANASQINVSFATAPPHNVTVVVSTGGGAPGPPASNVYYLTYYQTIPAIQAGSPYTLTHNLNSTQIHVQLWDAVTGQLVQAQVQIISANSVQISVAQTMPNNVNAVVMIGPSTPAPVNPGDMASKSYVDARTPNLPAPVASGSGVQSFTDALGDVWVAANGVNGGAWKRARDVLHAKIVRASAWNTSTTSVQFSFDAVNRDPYGMYSNGGWLIPVAGMYLWQSTITAGAVTSASFFMLDNQVNGTTVCTTQATAASGGPGGITCVAVAVVPLFFNTGDALKCFQRCGVAVAGQTGTNYTHSTLDYLGTG